MASSVANSYYFLFLNIEQTFLPSDMTSKYGNALDNQPIVYILHDFHSPELLFHKTFHYLCARHLFYDDEHINPNPRSQTHTVSMSSGCYSG